MDNAGHFCYNAVKSVKVTSGAEQKIGRKKTSAIQQSHSPSFIGFIWE